MFPSVDTLDSVKAAAVYIRCFQGNEGSTGSGFFAERSGYVVTNWHVIIDNPNKPRRVVDKIEVVVASGTREQRTFRAQVIGYDAIEDLALLKVTGDDLPKPLKFGKAANLVETEDVYLFGFPGGERLGKNISVNKTSVSSVRKEGRDVTRVDFAGGSFFGSSGGPVTNLHGEVVGVCQGGIDGSQINFAIPAEKAAAFVEEQIRTGGQAKKATKGRAVASGSESDGSSESDSRRPTKKDPRRFDGPVEGPPEEEFWDRYNKRLEFPLAAVATVLLHVIVGVGLVYVLLTLMRGDDGPGPKLELVAVGGMDDTGEGSAGSGGNPDPDLIRDVSPEKSAKDVLPTPQALADARENIQKTVLEDPAGKIPIAASNAASLSQLNEELRKKLLGVGSQKGEGNQPGKGFDGTAGAGPGGTGADSTRARGLRWVLRFKVSNGRDYLAQLEAMEAELLFPVPGGKDSIIIKNLKNPSGQKVANDADLSGLARKIQFSDNRRDAVQGVAGALGLEFTPKTFFAFFPRGVEDTLARLETSYRNRRAEDIEETVFRVTIRGGSYEFVVDEQVVKK